MSEEDYKIAYENAMIANKMLEKENRRLNNIINEIRNEVKIFKEQCDDGATCELDNYVFVTRLLIILDKIKKLKGSDKE